MLCLISSPKGLAAFCLLADKDSSFLKSSLYLYPGPRIHFSCIPVLVFIYESFFRTCLCFMNILFCAGTRRCPASPAELLPGEQLSLLALHVLPLPICLHCVLVHGVSFMALPACFPTYWSAPSLCMCWFASAVGFFSPGYCLFKAVCGWRGAAAASLV